MHSFLVLSEDNELRARIKHVLAPRAHCVESVDRPAMATSLLDKRVFDLVIAVTGVVPSSITGFLTAMRNRDPMTPVIAVNDGALAPAMRSMVYDQAFDWLTVPFDDAELEARVERAIEIKRLLHERQSLRSDQPLIYHPADLVGDSRPMREVLARVKKVAATDASVVLLGETGTGKELVAGCIHHNSARAGHAFVRVNCAALPDTLLESELFGHERGAFTGADKQRIGRFEQADGGTIFLDEVADMSSATQAKLLRVLQEQQFERLGSNRTVQIDVRVVAATNKNLERQVDTGQFRQDLFYRLNVMTIQLPPLRNRADDIVLLAYAFMKRYAAQLGKPVTVIDPSAMEVLARHRWPGNVRELRNAIERAVILADDSDIRGRDLEIPDSDAPHGDAGQCASASPNADASPGELSLEAVERGLILQALRRCRWVQKTAAAELGISARALNYRVKKLGITHPRWSSHR